MSARIVFFVCFIYMSCNVFASQPAFTTGIALTEKGEILLTQKGAKQVDLFSNDGQRLLRSFPLNETPTGV